MKKTQPLHVRHCHCGTQFVEGRCPPCDALKRPHQRRMAIRLREQRMTRIRSRTVDR